MDEMADMPLLEVDVIQRGIASWEWSVRSGEDVQVCGFEQTMPAARFAGNDALFLMLASGQKL
jgi:hypothetical protein